MRQSVRQGVWQSAQHSVRQCAAERAAKHAAECAGKHQYSYGGISSISVPTELGKKSMKASAKGFRFVLIRKEC